MYVRCSSHPVSEPQEVLFDCALPTSLVIFYFIGSYLYIPVFSVHNGPIFNYPPLDKLSAVSLDFLLSMYQPKHRDLTRTRT